MSSKMCSQLGIMSLLMVWGLNSLSIEFATFSICFTTVLDDFLLFFRVLRLIFWWFSAVLAILLFWWFSGCQKSEKHHFEVWTRYRAQKSHWFRKSYLEVRTRSEKRRKIDFSNLHFFDFCYFFVIFRVFGDHLQYTTKTADNEGAKMSKILILSKSDLKHPQTTRESHLDRFGGDWDRLGKSTSYTYFLDFSDFFLWFWGVWVPCKDWALSRDQVSRIFGRAQHHGHRK